MQDARRKKENEKAEDDGPVFDEPVPEMGKNIFALKIFLPAKLKSGLQHRADRAQAPISESVLRFEIRVAGCMGSPLRFQKGNPPTLWHKLQICTGWDKHPDRYPVQT